MRGGTSSWNIVVIHITLHISVPGCSDMRDVRALAESVETFLVGDGGVPMGRLIGDSEIFVYCSVRDANRIVDLLPEVARVAGVPRNQVRLIDQNVNTESAKANLCEPGIPLQRRPRRFDVWAIPLAPGGFGYMQILERHKEFLDLVRVFDAVTPRVATLEVILASHAMFPPIFTYVSPTAVRKDRLQFVGNKSSEYARPLFRHANLAMLYPDRYDSDWSIWTMEGGYTAVGNLSEEQRGLEPLVMWPIQDVRRRIEGRVGPRDVLQTIYWS